MKLFLVFCVFVIGAFAQKATYKNYGVHRVIPKTEDQVEDLKNLEKDVSYDFWTSATDLNKNVDIMVPPAKISDFNDFLSANKLRDKLIIKNVQTLIDAENKEMAKRSKTMDWKSYHTLEEFYDWMTKLEKKYKGMVKVVVIGKTYEKRDIKALEITFKKNQPTFYIEAGIHGREWITPATTSFMVNELLNISTVTSDVKKFNYIYVPFVNPDGYVYSMTKERLWRKTRSPQKNSACFGVDPYRNWDFMWNGTETKNPCSENYPGPKPFSEVETKSLSQYFDKNVKAKKIEVVLSFQSYGQRMMYPWAYTHYPFSDFQRMELVAKDAVEYMKEVDGAVYDVGPIGGLSHHACGSSVDYFFKKYHPKFVYAYDLRDVGETGFILPSKLIIPSGAEVLVSVLRIIKEYYNLFGKH